MPALTRALLAVALLKLLIALVLADRGFELGDEGLFLLNLNHPADAPPPFEFYRLRSLFGEGPWIDVVAARRIRIGAELLGSLALIAGVFAWARRRVFEEGAVGFGIFASVSLLGMQLSVASRSLGYNDVSNLFVYAALGALFGLAAIGPGREEHLRRSLTAAAAGGLTGLQVFVKFPPALLLWAATVAWLLLGFRWLATSERVRLAGVHGVATALGMLVLVVATGGLEELAPRLAVASVLPELTGYRPAAILARYLTYDRSSLLLAAAFAAVVLGAWRAGALRPHGKPDTALVLGLILATGAAWAAVAWSKPPYFDFAVMTLFVAGVGAAGALLVVAWRDERGDGSAMALLMLAGAPFVLIAGTNVPLTMRLPSHVLPLFVLVAVVACDQAARAGRAILLGVVAAWGVALTLPVFANQQVFSPYGLRAGIHQQTQPVEALPGVRVDLASARFLDAVVETLRAGGHVPGDPVVALDYMPGLVHLVGGRSPGFNFYMSGKARLNCFNLDRAGFDGPPYLILGRPMQPAQRACLEAFRFPDDFVLLRELRFPYDEVYAGFGLHGLTHVSIYGPRPPGG